MQSNEDLIESILNKMESSNPPPVLTEALRIFTKLVSK